MSNRHMKRCLTSLTITEMQIKTTVSYHLTPVRTAIIKKIRDSKCRQGCGEREFYTLWVGMQTGPTPMENNMEVPQKIKNRTTMPSSNSTLGMYPKEMKTELMHTHVYRSIIHNSQDMETTQMPINR